ncbi:vWA domain-containing protein [Polyangium aurulentum]|uniref:vWA domain-containing protein n=1 Tax=Polyangium aurulentum TaxID=2567896 RepID=UPI0010AE6EE1|nr:vWA domain-containing protein [Polyangium aurulentum]UQA59861.1 VWA domain-containing protein [Polyangium aurulentum]
MTSSKIVLCSFITVALSAAVVACGAAGSGTTSGDTTSGNGGAGGTGSSGTSGEPDPDIPFPSGGASSGGTGGSDCAPNVSQASFKPAYLGVAFDVSGSMGKLDKPYHDPKLKWEPVVAATKAFFGDPESKDISASLTFFPIPGGDSVRCEPKNYLTPYVPMTKLPSAAFATAIDANTPKTSSDWLGGTPTLAVVTGTFGFLEPMQKADPDALYALVLITDGYPAGCDDNNIASLEAAVAAVKDTIPTYVIGVQNPPGGPDAVTNLDAIAVAGGTEKAFIIETGDPEKTKADFKAIIDGIRKQAVSCEVPIPAPPPGTVFDAGKVNVTYTSSGQETVLGYDQTCTGQNAWRYDDPNAPKSIVLCDSTCTKVQADIKAELKVQFGCTTIEIPK